MKIKELLDYIMNNNDKKLKEYKKKQILKYLMIICSLSVIVLESFALFNVISYLWGVIPFVLNLIIKYFYEKENNKKR